MSEENRALIQAERANYHTALRKVIYAIVNDLTLEMDIDESEREEVVNAYIEKYTKDFQLNDEVSETQTKDEG